VPGSMQETDTVPWASFAIAAILDWSASWARPLRGTRAKSKAKARIAGIIYARLEHIFEGYLLKRFTSTPNSFPKGPVRLITKP
jgi:hypothetical protein